MTDDVKRAAEVLSEHRASIDRLDAILFYTLGERFKHTQAVGKLKAEHDLPPSDPAREAAQIERLEDWRNGPIWTPNSPRSFSTSSSLKSFSTTKNINRRVRIHCAPFNKTRTYIPWP